jgi:hypothetical protein
LTALTLEGVSELGRPSKFTEARRQRILAILAAGGSRRQAASVSGIGPATLTGWLQRGERVPGGRYGEFRRQVEEAESGRHRLVGLPTEDREELTWAVDFLDRVPDPDDGPTVIQLTWDE